jgi:predicted AlkP superfamily pyrophosphatase or phosphodiesterase
MIEKKRPDFLTAYFSSLDEEQHHTAPYSKATFETLEGLDALVGQVRAAAARAYGRRFVMSVVSDHGHITATRDVHVNAALHEAGLIDPDPQGRSPRGRPTPGPPGARRRSC